VGYREVLEGLRSGATVSATKDEVAAHTRQLARRQETWFRSFSEIRPVAVREPLDANAIAAQIAPLLRLDPS
jgi:tRNA dimethylallyltransferase